MRGTIAIDPESGARLSRESEYPYDGSFTRDDEGKYFHNPPSAVKAQTPIKDQHADNACSADWNSTREGALTTGELNSKHTALGAYFRRQAEAHGEHDPKVARKAGLAFKQLRSSTDAIDVFVWYATAQRLHEKGFDVRWMRGSVEPRCPVCLSACKPDYPGFRCASAPSEHRNVDAKIHHRVAEVHEATWGDEEGYEKPERVTAFDPPEAADA